MFELGLMSWFKLVYSAAFGLCVGSFLNVVIVRVPKKQSVVKPRSRCVRCKGMIHWKDNIPIISYFLLKGKCRQCKKKISIRYPIIEALTALLFVADALRFEGHSSWCFVLRDWPFLSLLVAMTFIDLEHRVIPDVLSISGLVVGLSTFWLVPEWSWTQSFGGALLGFSIFYALARFYYRLRGRVGLGGGDVKLLAMLGSFLGPYGVLATICMSSIVGSIVGLIWARTLSKKHVLEFAIPYGPFLVIGALVYYFLGELIWYLYMNQI